ncbi:bifunctional alpha/beta hydrolase/OsmC family protein [Agromyces bauzanensis]
MPDAETSGVALIDLGGRSFRVGRQFVSDLEAHHQRSRIAGLRAALLVMHSPTDRVVPIEHAREIFDAAPHPKSFVALDGADHLLSRRSDAHFVAEVIGAWARRYATESTEAPAGHAPRVSTVTTEVPTAERMPQPLDAGMVEVAESGRGPYGQIVTTVQHSLPADEPAPVGSDSGPSPCEYLLAALGACTSMTLRMYANRKNWPVGRIDVTLTHSRVHARDCAECETRTGQVDHIDRSIRIEGELSPEQREALLKIADRCPVHRTLRGGVEVAATLADQRGSDAAAPTNRTLSSRAVEIAPTSPAVFTATIAPS